MDSLARLGISALHSAQTLAEPRVAEFAGKAIVFTVPVRR